MKRKLAAMEIKTMVPMILLSCAGGIMIAINIPYNATLSALTIRSGRIFPDTTPRKVGDVVSKVTCSEKYVLEGNGPKVALMDFGAKNNIARSLNDRGCEVTVYPANTPAEEIISANPDGIMLSNGPGDPADCTSIIKEIRKLYDSDIPIFAICLGHQLMALANGGKTYKLKYGHRRS